ncbi:carbohydrate ABC transporter substrate-binding protein [Paenibacillus sp. 1011MAR3C5]|uniref:ABC transporter substrate-binding protein n=1 Tax=Paenibacillus sp. 1011MAR3C5 TaxID=1675787 RepID=UPI000E6BD7B3|nr:ABC transporter substrate-binding protein [Paenibacillus sp. 1011MAR3C5]RJE90855.1 carbohydrate ABC transporter substrate-binding protein [Paenibacillus sp. 1011MAR3C5]
MNRYSRAGIACLMLLAVFAQGCSEIGIGKKNPPNITVKVIAQPLERFTSFEPLLREQFPHITFEVRDPYDELRNSDVNRSPEDHSDAIAAIVEDTNADLFLNFSPDLYIKHYPLLDLAPLLQVYGIELNDYQKIMADQLTRADGSLTALSPTFNKNVLFVNAKLLREVNVDEPDSPMTWEAFRQTAAAVKEQSPEIKSYMSLTPQLWNLEWYGRIIMGWNIIEDNQLTLERPEWRQLYEQLFEDGLEEAIRDSKTYNPRTFDNTGLYITGAHYIRSLIKGGFSSEDWSIVPLPRDPMNQHPVSISPTNSFAIHAESEYIDDLMEVVAYLMSKEAAARIDADVIGSTAGQELEAMHNPFGFVTYPDEVSYHPFSTQAIFETGGANTPLSTATLSNAAYGHLYLTFEEQFKAVAKGDLTFDQAWERVAKTVEEINNDPNNFTAAD